MLASDDELMARVLYYDVLGTPLSYLLLEHAGLYLVWKGRRNIGSLSRRTNELSTQYTPPKGFWSAVVLLALFWRHPRWPIFYQILRWAWCNAMPKETSRSLILDYTAQNIFFAVYNIHGVDPLLINDHCLDTVTVQTNSTDYHPLIFSIYSVMLNPCWSQGSDWKKYACVRVEASLLTVEFTGHQRFI